MFYRNVLLWTMVFAMGILLSNPLSASAAEPKLSSLPDETKQQRDARMAWWREARFGMFIHWGIYAIPGGEWKGKDTHHDGAFMMADMRIPLPEYEALLPQFNPVKFNAAQWAGIAKNAGMKYVVLTTKHHDGFCLFDSKLTDFSATHSAFQRDIMKELSEAVRAAGLTMGCYYSLMDWHHPDYIPRFRWSKQTKEPAGFDSYIEFMKGQLRELLTNYGPIGVVWFDGCWEHNDPQETHAVEMVKMMRQIQPNLIVNDRLRIDEDFSCPEQFIPGTGIPNRDWETCMTINDTWGFRKADHNWKSTQTLLRNLIDVVSKGGNYLLNVGPTPEGEIPAECVKSLEEIGRWMAVNNEAIYGTAASPFRRLNWGRCTQKPGKLYLHVFDWPAGELVVPGLKNKVQKAYLLSDPAQKPLAVSQDKDEVIIRLPAQAPDKIASVVVLSIAGPAEVAPYSVMPVANGSMVFLANEAAIHGDTAKFIVNEKEENIGDWTNQRDWISWDFTVKKPAAYEVEITFSCANDSAGSEYAVEAAGKKLTAKVEGTGGWNKFVAKNLGTVAIDAPGRYTLAIRPTAMPQGAVMKLKSLLMKPVAGK